MAGPYKWVDDLARQGWLPRLGAAELRLLWAVGVFWMRGSDDARADSRTLRAVTGLSESAFYEARNELVRKRLLRTVPGTRQGKFRPYRVTVYQLISPIPQAPSTPPPRRRGTSTTAPSRRSKDSAPAEYFPRSGGEILSPNPAPDAANGPLKALVSNQLVVGVVRSKELGSEAIEVRAWCENLVGRFPSADGEAILRGLVVAVRVVRRRPQAIEHVAFSLSRHLQSLGAFTWELQVLDRFQAVAGLPHIVTASEPLDLDPYSARVLPHGRTAYTGSAAKAHELWAEELAQAQAAEEAPPQTDS